MQEILVHLAVQLGFGLLEKLRDAQVRYVTMNNGLSPSIHF